jgi:ABC-type polysaccharide/polyol phosphate transport system ATPase subunit
MTHNSLLINSEKMNTKILQKDIVISFSNVSKKYKKGRKLLLKEALLDVFKPGKQEDFYALKDINFDVKKGETLGIIGPNGSGKSTILKLIAGVTSPTSGKVEVKGKIAPLIELGAGFHPELTGRENVYLNGTILGLTRKEIDKKFADILAFSDLGEFIDTPIKHYSSGMYVRLGFSIAVHTNPDILLVDEILAVGDESFQKKSIDRLNYFKRQGKTIIFVSHNLNAVEGFCDRVIYLKNAKVIKDGLCKEVVSQYRSDIFHK